MFFVQSYYIQLYFRELLTFARGGAYPLIAVVRNNLCPSSRMKVSSRQILFKLVQQFRRQNVTDRHSHFPINNISIVWVSIRIETIVIPLWSMPPMEK